MLSTTLKDYIKTYEANLNAFLAAYEDNSEKFFFQKEFGSYTEYYNTLIDILDLIREQVDNRSKEIILDTHRVQKLHKLNSVAYDNIITKRLFKIKDSGPPDFLFEGIPPNQVYVDSVKLENHISSANAIIDLITGKMNNSKAPIENIQSTKVNPAYDDYKDKIWFKVGLLFANGTMKKYYKLNDKGIMSFEDNYTAPKVALELGNTNYNKLILAAINDYPPTSNNANKNIFNSRDKMEKIISYCEKHNIEVIPYFIKRMPPE